jgi:biopolymer transport protein ExbB
MSVLQTLALGGLAVYPLLLLGVIMTVIVLDKFILHLRYARLPVRLRALVETFGFDWDALRHEMKRLPQGNLYRRFFSVIETNRDYTAWWIESRAGDEARMVDSELGQGLWMLETIVTAAPLIGLLGTIIGMMHSFQIIGVNGLVKPEEVTGGVAQALIATALGLIIALFALFAFNYLARRNAQVMDELELLGTRMTDHIRFGQDAAAKGKAA